MHDRMLEALQIMDRLEKEHGGGAATKERLEAEMAMSNDEMGLLLAEANASDLAFPMPPKLDWRVDEKGYALIEAATS